MAQAWFDTGGVKVEGAMAARCRAQQPSSGSSAASENDDFVSRSSQDDDAGRTSGENWDKSTYKGVVELKNLYTHMSFVSS